MKVIDLLNKIANGEIDENIIVEFDNGYKDYCNVRMFFDRYIMDRENLNLEVEIIEEDKKIEKLPIGLKQTTKNGIHNTLFKNRVQYELNEKEEIICSKINEIIDYLEENK